MLWPQVLTLWISLLALLVRPNNSTPIVDLGYARYRGAVDTATNVTTFLGVRYAAPPINEGRFSAPQAPAYEPGVQEATSQPDECFQTMDFATSPAEDCLFLNVYYPSDAAGVPVGRLPTLVYIHGGSYLLGGARQFRGTDLLAQSNRGIVVVIIQYRLSIFGFLPGTEVKKHGALNAGLLDQDFALRWVQKHISKFGGDPTKVTIWGESAGAGSVLQQVIAHNGRTEPQLFRAAITSSTCITSQYSYDDPIAENLYSQVVNQANCTTIGVDSLACLRRLDAAALMDVHQSIHGAGFFGTVTFGPVVDGEFITQRPTLALAQGRVNGQALLSVTNTFEGTIFVNQSAPEDAAQYARHLFPKLDAATGERVAALYDGLGTDVFQNNAIMGETIFICPSYFLQRAFGASHRPAFKGEFAVPQGLHGRDLQYYFPSLPLDVPVLGYPEFFNNTVFINAFARSFISFAISLDPNVKVAPTITPRWDTWADGEREMVFNRTEAGVPLVRARKTDEALLERCRFWESMGEFIGQ
ncbi:Alpha/Beta hydrolase protein [Mycena filopes]|nr:Alpha/Beta hydrolase protein [Mycena filopes]